MSDPLVPVAFFHRGRVLPGARPLTRKEEAYRRARCQRTQASRLRVGGKYLTRQGKKQDDYGVMALSLEQEAFAARCFCLIRLLGGSYWQGWLGAAIACHESGWGKEIPADTNNYVGYKAVDGKPQSGPWRVFTSLEDCLKSWLYLAAESSLYEKPRRILNSSLERAHDFQGVRSAWLVFAREFGMIYCPSPEAGGDDAQGGEPYAAAIRAMMLLIEDLMERADKGGKSAMSGLLKTKTFWGGLASIVTGAGMCFMGQIPEGAVLIGQGVIAIFVRDAIKKAEVR